MTVLISSHLFNEPTHLSDIYDRARNTTGLWTFPYSSGDRFAGKPIFVLTSAGGGAHPMAPHRIDDHFVLRVPFARFINPVTKTDWEGTGVEPDIKVPATEALDVAKKLAAEAIRKD